MLKRAAAAKAGIYGNDAVEATYPMTKTLADGEAKDEPLLGTGDIQSLADLANSYEVVGQMKLVPVSYKVALSLVVAAVAPLLPLLLFRFSLEDLLLKS